jgi:hypothetical protein
MTSRSSPAGQPTAGPSTDGPAAMYELNQPSTNTVGRTVNASYASARGEELANPIATRPLDSEDRKMLTRLPLSLIVELAVD